MDRQTNGWFKFKSHSGLFCFDVAWSDLGFNGSSSGKASQFSQARLEASVIFSRSTPSFCSSSQYPSINLGHNHLFNKCLFSHFTPSPVRVESVGFPCILTSLWESGGTQSKDVFSTSWRPCIVVPSGWIVSPQLWLWLFLSSHSSFSYQVPIPWLPNPVCLDHHTALSSTVHWITI